MIGGFLGLPKLSKGRVHLMFPCNLMTKGTHALNVLINQNQVNPSLLEGCFHCLLEAASHFPTLPCDCPDQETVQTPIKQLF